MPTFHPRSPAQSRGRGIGNAPGRGLPTSARTGSGCCRRRMWHCNGLRRARTARNRTNAATRSRGRALNRKRQPSRSRPAQSHGSGASSSACQGGSTRACFQTTENLSRLAGARSECMRQLPGGRFKNSRSRMTNFPIVRSTSSFPRTTDTWWVRTPDMLTCGIPQVGAVASNRG